MLPPRSRIRHHHTACFDDEWYPSVAPLLTPLCQLSNQIQPHLGGGLLLPRDSDAVTAVIY